MTYELTVEDKSLLTETIAVLKQLESLAPNKVIISKLVKGIDGITNRANKGKSPDPFMVYTDWKNAIKQTNIAVVDTPIGVSFTSAARLMLNYSLTPSMECGTIDNAHSLVHKHFVDRYMKQTQEKRYG